MKTVEARQNQTKHSNIAPSLAVTTTSDSTGEVQAFMKNAMVVIISLLKESNVKVISSYALN